MSLIKLCTFLQLHKRKQITIERQINLRKILIIE